MSLFRPARAHFAQVIALVWVGLPMGLSAQETTPSALASLVFAPLEFRQPDPVQYCVDPGVEVFFVEDHSLPLVSVFAPVPWWALVFFEGGAWGYDRRCAAPPLRGHPRSFPRLRGRAPGVLPR